MKTKSSNYGLLQFQVWICIIFHGQNLYEFQRSNNFLNLICFIFIHLANKAFQITVKTPDVVHFEFLDLA